MMENHNSGGEIADTVDQITDCLKTESDCSVKVEVDLGGGEKRKRGRPPKAQAKPLSAPAKRPPGKKMMIKEKEEEEDVCFICFDGGSLVLCDHRYACDSVVGFMLCE